MTGPQIILTLKILVSIVTILFALSLVALAKGKTKLHGRINTAFFVLTMLTVIVFELLIRFSIDVSSTFSPEARSALKIHLFFSVPAAFVLPAMFLTGRFHRRSLHIGLGILFTILWIGTFITGIFTIPHQ